MISPNGNAIAETAFIPALDDSELGPLFGRPEELERSPGAARLMSRLTNRDFAYLLVPLAVIRRLDWFLPGAAAGTYFLPRPYG